MATATLPTYAAPNLPGLVQSTPDLKARTYAVHGLSIQLVRDSKAHKLDLPAADTPSRAAAALFPFVGQADRESFLGLLLNARSGIIGVNVISVGTVSASLVHPREVFKPAILAGACALIVAHNHPSGDVTPSQEDKDVTRKLCRAGELLGIPLLDHLILGHDAGSWYSFKDHGLLS